LIAGAVAKRYARALADVAAEQQALDAVRRDLTAFAGMLREQRELRQLLANPSVLRADTVQVVGEIARRMDLSPLSATFLTVLAEAGRLPGLEGILRAFEALVDERLGRVKATVATAAPLTSKETEALRATLTRRTGKDVYLEVREDPALLGGLVAQIGSQVYDGSLRTRLMRLREELAGC
jgi:F-type H+-transporting ATPase subunit delta